ncbi:flagellin, partial [Oerskovia turbata]|uniref:flagellin n=1 Tax=Oerskovia turbata TaxID=1713 RepID=UPI0004BFA1D9
DELANELTRVVDSTNFNGINLLTAAATDLTVQVSAEGAGSGNTITIALAANDLETIIGAGIAAGGGGSSLTVDTAANGQAAIETIDTALKAVSTARSNFGATQNRLEYAISNISRGGGRRCPSVGARAGRRAPVLRRFTRSPFTAVPVMPTVGGDRPMDGLGDHSSRPSHGGLIMGFSVNTNVS